MSSNECAANSFLNNLGSETDSAAQNNQQLEEGNN